MAGNTRMTGAETSPPVTVALIGVTSDLPVVYFKDASKNVINDDGDVDDNDVGDGNAVTDNVNNDKDQEQGLVLIDKGVQEQQGQGLDISSTCVNSQSSSTDLLVKSPLYPHSILVDSPQSLSPAVLEVLEIVVKVVINKQSPSEIQVALPAWKDHLLRSSE